MQQLLSEKRIVKNEKWCKSGMKRVELNELGKIVSGGTPDTTVGEYWGGSINWVTPTDITALKGSKYLYDTKRKITEKGLKNSSAEIIPIDSIVITSRATIGEIAINKEPITTNQGFKSIIPNPQKVNTEYLYYLLQTKKHQLIALGSGSTFFEVSKTDIFHFSLFIVNSIEEQTAIAQVLQAVDKEISLLKAKVEKLKEQKKGLMQILLTGKVRLKIN
jgi:type I restriction enzyme S subunit